MSTSTNAQPTPYPEHEKLKALDGENNTIGRFLEWLDSEGIELARAHEHNDECGDDADSGDIRRNYQETCWLADAELVSWRPKGSRGGLIQAVLAEYFGIDQDKLEAEKRSMLDEIRKSQRATAEVR